MKNHVILNHLDKPTRLLIWPASQVVAVILPTVVFMAFGKIFEAFIVVFAIILGMRWYKKRFGSHTLVGVLYWVLPHNQKSFKVTPPSHIREYIA